MFSQPMIRDWARRLVASEASAEPLSAQTEVATLRVYQKLRQKLCAPVGADGFHALASRALSLTQSQYPRLSAVQVMASGDLHGLGEVGLQTGVDEESEVGTILIAQLLGLFLALLGEDTTVRLIDGSPLWSEVTPELDLPGPTATTADIHYFGPFENILLEAEQLRSVSARLEALVGKHVGIDEVMSVAGSIRNMASVLDVFTIIRRETGNPTLNAHALPKNGYLN